MKPNICFMVQIWTLTGPNREPDGFALNYFPQWI